jgi:hypothetical protein
MEKYNNNTRFAPLRDAPFAHRGKHSWIAALILFYFPSASVFRVLYPI